MKTVINVIEQYLPQEAIDKNFLGKIKKFRLQWGSKDEKYIEFLSSGLVGVHPIRFSDKDEDLLYREVFNIDKETIRQEFYKTPGINKNFVVSSNPTNIILISLLTLVWNSKLPENIRLDGITDLYHIFCYKQIGSMYSHYFKYEVALPKAKALFESLSDKFLLKKLGTWEDVFNHQAKTLLPPRGNATQKIKRGSTDDIVKVINDFYSRLKSIIKNLYVKVKDFDDGEYERIGSSSLHNLIEGDDGSADGLKAMTDNYNSYITYLRSIYNHPNDFIKSDYIKLVCSLTKTADKEKFKEVLLYMSENELVLDPSRDYLKATLETCFTYLASKGISSDYKRKMSDCLKILNGFFKASKAKDPNLLLAKETLEEVAGEALQTSVKWILAPIVLCILLYLFIRAVVK